MKKLHLIMPMAGSGSRFTQNGFYTPKPLIKINNKPFFVWSVYSIIKFIDIIDITFVILQEHIDRFYIDQKILEYFPNSKLITIPYVLDGAALTCMEACNAITDDNYILFNDCDHMFMSTSLNDFFSISNIEHCDAGLVTFESKEPQFSFVQFDDKGDICGTIEKKCVSNRAIIGAYLFKNATTYQKACSEYLLKCDYKEFFVSGIYNIIFNHHGIIKEFPANFHVNYGTPIEYERAKESDYFRYLI